jgi:vacuolar iron transporter family protein
MRDLSRFSFGATSAVTSSLALMIGLSQLDVSKVGLIGALLVIALADNIADTLGMHIYSESKSKAQTKKLNSATNYITRLCITLLLISFVAFLPFPYALAASVIVGLLVIALLSYFIAKEQGLDARRTVAEHLAVTVLVLIVSQLVGSSIRGMFSIP